ncbi:hypothetical protein Adeg_0926 [Ammonifex degensii KC4]|uniref:Arginase n=1 Tax=Ammonifex degensii (strain DSM 10501 / KC4) TaxID=429009 RepID=C9RCT5_AMMDK|nr:hypothetical protein [Ammonifex degensii]ACX52062.1 hypothetical protein Adeg_0926 [Ammonifex degensii KC4]
MVGYLDLEGTYAWQPQFQKLAFFRLVPSFSGLKYLSTPFTLRRWEKLVRSFPGKLFFLGEGSYHHLSLSLLARRAGEGPLCLLVCDRHLDSFPAPEGYITCGSWLNSALRLPGVRKVIVLGCEEEPPEKPKTIVLLSPAAWQYWFRHDPRLITALIPTTRVYLSLDKDVLELGGGSWGKGKVPVSFFFSFLHWLLRRYQLVGMDVCGEPVPRHPWPTFTEKEVIAEHERVNLALCHLVARSLPSRKHRVRAS